MSHLTAEDLARLVDESPGAQEAAHLEACEQCRVELGLMREDVQALSLLPDVMPAPDSWDVLERRLTQEGLIRQQRIVPVSNRMLQMAAALVLFLAGSLAGRMTAGGGEPMVAHVPGPPSAGQAPGTAGSPTGPPSPTGQPSPDTQSVAAVQEEARQREESTAPAPRQQPRRNSSVSLASSGFDAGSQATTMDDAIAVLRQAEELYLAALTRYAELATQSEAGDPVARLAAMQSIVNTTQAALNQTPMDPVINGYHLTALAQRDATLRQVAAATGDRWY